MSKINTIKNAIWLCRVAGVTPFIWGHRGLGKSSLVRQVCGENGMGFIDLRCSQIEASDLRGLPDQGEDGRTHYLPPADMPVGDMNHEQVTQELCKILGLKFTSMDKALTLIAKEVEKIESDLEDPANLEKKRQYDKAVASFQPRFQKGILFLDELNRGQDDVLQAAFELVLDRKIGAYTLPPGWSVACAGNFAEGDYTVSGFNDAAFLDRFCHLTLSAGESTLEEWVDYMSSRFNIGAAAVIEFASQNVEHLDGKIEGESNVKIQPSRRSWEKVARLVEARITCEDPNAAKDEDAYNDCLAGLVGRELALAFMKYDCPVKPADLLKKGVGPYKKKLTSLKRNQLVGLMWGLVSFCKDKVQEDDVAEVCLDFSEHMAEHAKDKDVVVAFVRALVGGKGNNQERAKMAVISNPELARLLSQYTKEQGGEKNFIDRLTERPKLQDILKKVSWGEDDS